MNIHHITTEKIASTDPEISEILNKEYIRQIDGLEMIASENYASEAVMAAQGTVLTNKYAEGYPGKRYYGGCHEVDKAETIAINRAKELFSAEHANVQPHSGSQANMAVYLAALKPGEKVLGMDLSHGGHLTHGSPVNFSGMLFDACHYGLNKDSGLIDYNEVESIAVKEKPQLIIAGYSAYPRTLDFSAFKTIADKVGAKLLVDMAHFAGLVASGHHDSPVPYADYITSTTHKTLRGPRGGIILCKEEHAKKVNSRIFPGIQGGPLEHVIAAKAVAFGECLKPDFKTYIGQVIKNAKTLGETLLSDGLNLVTDGTDNHLLLIDLSASKVSKDITGKQAEEALDKAGITVNKNTVPNEKRSPFVTSGIRIGSPALTSRGMKEAEMVTIAHWISEVINNFEDEALLARIKNDVKNLTKSFPIY